MSSYPSLGIHRLAEFLTDTHFKAMRRRAVQEGNRRLARYCDLAMQGSERARLAVARFMLTGKADSRPSGRGIVS